MKTITKTILYFEVLFLLVACLSTSTTGNVVQSPSENVSTKATFGDTITPTTESTFASSPTPISPSGTMSLSGTSSFSPSALSTTPMPPSTSIPNNNGATIIPIVSPGPTSNGTQDPKYCYSVPSPQLDKNNPDFDIYLSGVFYLCNPYYTAIDLDRMIIGDYFVLDPARNLDGADVWLRWGNVPNEALLLEMDNVFLTATFENTPPTIDDCVEKFSGFPYGGLLFIVGDKPEIIRKYGCIKTTEGRIGYLKLEEVNPLGELSLKVRFVIWNLTMK